MTKHRSLLLFLGIVAVIGSIWLYTFLASPSRQSLDQRVHDVASQLKCLVCQGESVADSPATLSLQMRGVIRQQLQSGKSEQEVIQYFVSRYGDRILLSPPMQGITLLAWIVPIALMILGALLVFFVLRSWQSSTAKEPVDTHGAESINMDEQELAYYQRQVEQELAAEDPVFSQPASEAK
ncbi:MAG TPA: cytochrome c-type biogenesis protein [Ktedonobacteraceae bacterium]|nr:cytochrome c-type biogenesis protein [Ktedonobacteraceae bacterium]